MNQLSTLYTSYVRELYWGKATIVECNKILRLLRSHLGQNQCGKKFQFRGRGYF